MISLMQESLLASPRRDLDRRTLGHAVAGRACREVQHGRLSVNRGLSGLACGDCRRIHHGNSGRLPPAWRCLRLPITEALKAS